MATELRTLIERAYRAGYKQAERAADVRLAARSGRYLPAPMSVDYMAPVYAQRVAKRDALASDTGEDS